MSPVSAGAFRLQAQQDMLQQTANNDTNTADDDGLTSNSYYRSQGQEQILVHSNHCHDGHFEQGSEETWESDTPIDAPRASTRSLTKSYTARMSRQKSRRRDLLGRPAKPGITVDTSFTRHRGSAPRQVYPRGDGRSSGSVRKSSWFGLGRSSTKNKGLGITKGTPQPEFTHRTQSSVENDATAMSLASSNKSWRDISPWDRRIPIGITVPTDSVSDFGSYQATRARSGSNATIGTPSIIITPAAPMQSVWSPDTPFTESEYTPSVYSRHPFHSSFADIPPVPSLPAEISQSSNSIVNADSNSDQSIPNNHARNDTLDSAGTAFEEFEEPRKKDRIMSSGTVFEEDEMPLRGKKIETSLAIDTSVVPTPRRSQGWWNVITTPFVTTPNTATWGNGNQTPDVPTVPFRFESNLDSPSLSTANVPPMIPSQSTPQTISKEEKDKLIVSNNDSSKQTVAVGMALPSTTQFHTTQSPVRNASSTAEGTVTSPFSTMSSTPVLATAALGTVSMPRQVEEPRQININIEMQDRWPTVHHSYTANRPSATQHPSTSMPAQSASNSGVEQTRRSPQTLPVFAPPPTFAQKGSHFSHDNLSRSSSLVSSSKPQKAKKHRKVCSVRNMLPFGKKRNSRQQGGDEAKKKKKKRGVCFWSCCCCFVFLILLAIIIPVIVILLRKQNRNPTSTVPTQDGGSPWVNLPDHPPMPTGVLTVAQPEAVEEESGCVAPTTLWSCALPKELQASVAPNKPDQPNFRIEITLENGTSAQLPVSSRIKRSALAGAFIRSRLLQLRAAPSPSPAPPSDADMRLLGQSTDGNSAPFEGEATPFFITFLDSTSGAPGLAKRNGPSDPTNITAVIPPPMLNSDGTAAPANLLPAPSAQPLRLYNRGRDDEYYGFYTYFDRSIFLKQINGVNRGGNPADTNGGSARDAAKLRCTYAQTRFLVQIWTRSKNSKPLLQSSTPNNSSAPLKRPGSFPYPVSFTLDRHGGDASKKNVYCYEMEDDGTIKNEASKRSFQFEDRAFGGNLVNGTQGRTSVRGPIDGGTGGCRCQWQNWLS